MVEDHIAEVNKSSRTAASISIPEIQLMCLDACKETYVARNQDPDGISATLKLSSPSLVKNVNHARQMFQDRNIPMTGRAMEHRTLLNAWAEKHGRFCDVSRGDEKTITSSRPQKRKSIVKEEEEEEEEEFESDSEECEEDEVPYDDEEEFEDDEDDEEIN
jgi:hypothetical protein